MELTSIDLDSLPRIAEGEIQLPAALPTFEGNGTFWLSRYGGLNPRQLARVDGVWYVRWPGFSWRKANENQM